VVRLLTLLGILVVLITPLFGSAHASADHAVNSDFIAPLLLIDNNTTIGVTGYRMSYYLNDNITIPVGRTFTLLDLNVYVQIGAANITDFGCLRIMDTSIHTYAGNHSLSTEITGTDGNPATLTVENSSWSIPGFISMSHSVDRISNSSLSSGIIDPADTAETLSFATVNSSLSTYNSTFSGLMHTNPIAPIDTAYFSYSKDIPFSTDGAIPLSKYLLTTADPLVTNIEVNLTFSGNNPTGLNTLNFSYSGNSESYRLGNTGSVHNKAIESFNLTLSNRLSSVSELVNNFTVLMYVSNTIGSNSSIEALNVSLLSNDTVSIYGLRYFSYEIYNSTITFARSSILLDMNRPYLYDNLLNPDHDFLHAVNSSIYMLGSEINGISGNFSFYTNNNSTFLLFSYVQVNATTGFYEDSNYPLTISPLTCATFASSMNMFAETSLSAMDIHEGRMSNNSYAYYLLTGYIKGSILTYTGNYAFGVYNFTYQISLPEYNYSSLNLVNETLHTDLPILSLHLMTESLVMNASNKIALNISLTGCESMKLSINEIINLGNAKSLTILNETVTIRNGVTIVTASNFSIPYLNSNQLSLNVSEVTSAPTYMGEKLAYKFDIPLHLNLMLRTTYSYAWLHDEDEIMLTVNYSMQTTPFNYSYNVMASLSTLSSQLNVNRTGHVIALDQKGSLHFLFNLTTLAVNATVVFAVSNSSFLLENYSSTLFFRIGENSSYFPESTLYIKVEGLPEYTAWTISIGNSSYSSSQTDLTINVPNGIYNYSFLQIPGYISNLSSGVLIATHQEEYLNVSFSQYTYTVMIVENGLQANSTWSVHTGGRTIYTNTSSVILSLPNGSYSFSISSQGFKSQNESYGIFVSGSGVIIHVVFVKIQHISILAAILREVYGSPFSYIVAAISFIIYFRFYRGSVRLCSTCLRPIRRGRLKCSHCNAVLNHEKGE